VGGALAAYALALGGYKSGAAQSADAVFGIQVAAGAIPAVLALLALLVMSKYKLTDALHAEILAEIRARRTSSEDDADATGSATGRNAGRSAAVVAAGPAAATTPPATISN
jgi:glucuronide carrier protein